MDTTRTYTISELADHTGVTTRTIRYYTAEGLLPPPDTRGKYALYSEEHVLRLLAITRLKDAYLPLSEIRNRLEGLTKPELHTFLAKTTDTVAPEPSINASAYIARIQQSYPGAPRVIAEQSSQYQQAPLAPAAAPLTPVRGYAEQIPSSPRAEQHWRRITLSSDVELHIREPHSPWLHERIQQLIEQAQQLLNEKEDHS